eukprot:1158702-Pelagomonas_calceolata.AAC.13
MVDILKRMWDQAQMHLQGGEGECGCAWVRGVGVDVVVGGCAGPQSSLILCSTTVRMRRGNSMAFMVKDSLH